MGDLLILLAFFSLGLSLNTSHGMFAWKELFLISGTWLFMLAKNAVELPHPKLIKSSLCVQLAGIVCLLFIVIAYFNPIVLQQEIGTDADLMNYSLLLGISASVVLCCGLFAKNQAAAKVVFFSSAVIAGLLVLARIFTIRSAPSPFIDVFTIDTAAADFLVRGLNPYSQHYPDIYGGAYDYAPGYTYWPAVMYWQTISRELFGDIRYGYVIADLATAWSIRSILVDFKWAKIQAGVLALLWLAFPVSFFVLDESWVDVPFVACAALFLAFAVKRRWIWAGVFLGLFCSIKQYAVFFAVFGALYVLWQEKPRWNWTGFFKVIGAAFSVMAVMFVPFMIWDWDGFYSDSVRSVLDQKIRWDALSWVPALIRLHWLDISFSDSLILYGVTFVASIGVLFKFSRREDLRALGFSLVLTYGVTFLFGKTAFCNYYYLLAFFMLIYFVGRPTSAVSSA
jgi:hypothetical protein